MHGNVPFGVASATELHRQESRAPTKMSVNRFGPVAKLIWPIKTAAVLAEIAGREIRTAERWLSGEFEPPASVIAALIVEITKRN
jgi:hypothetical protein